MRNCRTDVLATGRSAVAGRDPSIVKVKQVARLLTVVAAVALLMVPARALAAPSAQVLPAKAAPYGHTYSEWAALWWQWLLGQPAGTNPLLDETGANCAQGQQGPVWFLAGGFGGITRSCAVPVGRALLIPVVNFFNGAYPAGGESEASLRSLAASVILGTTNLAASIDGALLGTQQIRPYYEESAVFSVTVPADNLRGLDEGAVVAPSVDAGYSLVIPPLSRGRHDVSVSATFPDGNSIGVTYHLTIG